MKLTFAKAEHLKCNATKSPDPRSVFQALRPVFNDYVSEIQRSIGYFSSVNREAKISKVVGLGNGFKLAGLQKFLQQNLQYEVERVESFSAITTDSFKDAALFEENILSFPVCYGVALQALRQTRIRTSLLPKEITTARTIARKKPWAVGAAAALLVGVALSAFGYAHVYQSVAPKRFDPALKKISDVITATNANKKGYGEVKSANQTGYGGGQSLLHGSEGRNNWLELYKAVDECLPDDKDEIADVRKQSRVRIFSLQARYKADLGEWYNGLSANAKQWLDDNAPYNERKTPPTGAGWVVQLRGEHMHDETMGTGRDEKDWHIETSGRGAGWLYDHFVKQLQQWAVPSHNGSGEVGVRKIGISYATIAFCPPPDKQRGDPLGRIVAGPGHGGRGRSDDKWGRKGKRPGGASGFGGRGGGNGNDDEITLGGLGRGFDFKGKGDENQLLGHPDETKTPKSIEMEVNHFVVEFIWRPDIRPAPPVTVPAGAATAAVAPAKPGAPAASPTKK
jgi:type IV pilus assembly protein PilM